MVVAGWIKEVEGARLAAERELAEAEPTPTLTRQEVRALVSAVRDRLIGLDGATPEQQATLYGSMGLCLTYHPDAGRLEIECRPACTQVRVGGPSSTVSDWRVRWWVPQRSSQRMAGLSQ